MRLEKQRRNDWQTNSMAEQHQVGLLYLTCLLLYLRCLNAFSFVVDVRYHIDKQDMKQTRFRFCRYVKRFRSVSAWKVQWIYLVSLLKGRMPSIRHTRTCIEVQFFDVQKLWRRYRAVRYLGCSEKLSKRYCEVRHLDVAKLSKRYHEVRYFDEPNLSIRYIGLSMVANVWNTTVHPTLPFSLTQSHVEHIESQSRSCTSYPAGIICCAGSVQYRSNPANMSQISQVIRQSQLDHTVLQYIPGSNLSGIFPERSRKSIIRRESVPSVNAFPFPPCDSFFPHDASS